MKNIERFNLYTAYLLGKLYDEFPVARTVETKAVIDALKLPAQEKDEKHTPEAQEHQFVSQTLMWLVDTEYLIKREAGSGVKRYVLSPKAFEALNATLSTLEGKSPKADEKSVGERLSEVAADAGKEMAKEGLRKVMSEMVGQVIGHAMKVLSGPS